MKSLRPRTRQVLLRLLSRRRGSVRSIRDLQYLTEVLRFSGLFGALVLVPVLLLAALALRSLEGEELLVDVGLHQRADAIATQVEAGLRGIFDDFEERVQQRLAAGDLHLSELGSPGLRAVFRFDADGRLVAPLQLPPEEAAWPEPSPAYERAWRSARQAEARGDLEAAVVAWEEARAFATAPPHAGEARLGRARALARLGDPRAADELVLVAAEHPHARDRHGVRIADLANLLRGELALEAGREEEGAAILRSVLERTLAAGWYAGLPAEPFVGSVALDRLQGRMDPRAHRAALARLGERAGLLHWATEAADELRLVAGRGRVERTFEYHPEDRALWVTLRFNDALWAFSFDYDRVRRELDRRVVDVAGKVDPDLTARLVRAREDVGPVLARRSLAPELPRAAVVVHPSDPATLASLRATTRLHRLVVIALAVIAALFGMFASVRAVNRELDTARQKADFAANVSHELRSPITQIRLKGESLQLDLVYDDDDRRAHYDAIVRESERLSRLVDNVLDFSSIERGVKRYTLRPDDLTEVVRRAVEATRSAADGAGLQIRVDVPEDLPVVWIDREAISQVMTNLLSNAVKYGAGGDAVDVIAREGLDGVEVSVRDHGIGIAPDDQARIFEHFYRVSSADVRKQRGTGIGLTIVRYIVEAHGGSITVESELGRGSTFTVSLPLEPPVEASA